MARARRARPGRGARSFVSPREKELNIIATGKTTSRYVTITLDDSAGTPRNISGSVTSIGGIGLNFEQVDVTTFVDAVMQYLAGRGDAAISLSGVFNNTPVATAPAESGAHPVLTSLNGANTAATLTIAIGIRAAPATGDPKFSGEFTCLSYVLDGDLSNLNWTTELKPAFGTATPAWGVV